MATKKHKKKNNAGLLNGKLPLVCGIALALVAIIVVVCIVVNGKNTSENKPVVEVEKEVLGTDSNTDVMAVDADEDNNAASEDAGYNEKDYEPSGNTTANNTDDSKSSSTGANKNGNGSSKSNNNSRNNNNAGQTGGTELAIIDQNGNVVTLDELTSGSNTDSSSSSNSNSSSSSSSSSSSDSSSSTGSNNSSSSSNTNNSSSSSTGSSSDDSTPTPAPFYDASEGKVYETERIKIN